MTKKELIKKLNEKRDKAIEWKEEHQEAINQGGMRAALDSFVGGGSHTKYVTHYGGVAEGLQDAIDFINLRMKD